MPARPSRPWLAVFLAIALACCLLARPLSAGSARASGAVGFEQISSGANHTCAIVSSGEAVCWGDNRYGQLGDGTTTARLVPTPVSGLTDAVAISAGYFHTCAIRASGQAVCWGDNQSHQLGDDSVGLGQWPLPTPVAGLTDAVAISAGGLHTCAIRASGQAVCWGAGRHGQLGDRGRASHAAPTAVVGLGATKAISAGAEHTCAVLFTGRALCWGHDYFGQLGIGSRSDRLIATRVRHLGKVRAIAAGESHTCAILISGRGACWGHNAEGELGDGSPKNNRELPTLVLGLRKAKAIGAAGWHSCALQASGKTVCWGSGEMGELGIGRRTDRGIRIPTPVKGLGKASALSVGHLHTCALLTSGQAYCWGFNGDGELGDGTRTSRPGPVRVRLP